jgi:hypothetical protein
MPIQVSWTAIPNGIEDGKLKIVALASIKLTSPSATQTTLGAGFPAMLNWHKNKFSFKITFAGAMGVKTFNVGPVSVPSQQAWPAVFKSDTPVKPYKYEVPVKAWESYSVTRLLDSSKVSYAAVAAQSTVPKYVKVTDLISNPFKSSDIFRSPFFQDRLTIPGGPGGIRTLPGRGGEDEEDFGADLLAATDYGTGLYGSARELLTMAYSAACHEWRNEGGELPEESALWWEARQFFQAYDKHEEESDQGNVRPGQVRPGQVRPGVATPQIRPGVRPGVQKPYVDRYAGTPMAVQKPSLDFHEAVALLGEQPELMRQFGLMFDLEVPLAAAGLAPTGSVTLSASWSSESGSGTSVPDNPLTAYQFASGANVFLPAHKPGTTEYSRGFYNLGPDYVQITGVDVDSLALRTLDFASTIRGQFALASQTSMSAALGIASPPALTPGTTRPPTRPAGGNVVRPATGAAGAATSPQVRTAPRIAQQQMIYSEALFLKMGDRPDTAAPPGFRSAGISVARKDRSQKMMATVATATANIAKLAAPKSVSLYFEDMVRGYRMDVFASGKWHSLVTRQGSYTLPGNIPVPNVDEESWVSAAVSSDPAAAGAEKDKAKVHEVMVRWNGFSLVNQRPSQTLDQQNNLIEGGTVLDPRFPIRMQFKPRPGSIPSLRFGKKYRVRVRLATVAGTGPELGAASPGAPFETPELTYRRWESVPSPAFYQNDKAPEGESTQHIVIRKFVAAPTQINPSVRQLVPPTGEVSLAEAHGMFDTSGKPDPAKYSLIQERDNMQPLGRMEGDERKPYVGGKILRLPYLADPMASGVCIQGAPHIATPLQLNYNGAWPEQQSLQLEVRAGTVPSTASGDKFTLFLSPGEIAFPKVSSTTPASQAENFGILEWTATPTRASLTALIPQGRVWTVTPFREATVVFACQVPEQKAAIDRPVCNRREGATNATLGGRIQTHSWTTASVDFQSKWTDDVDLLEEPRRTTLKQDRSTTGFKLKIVRGPTAPVVFQPFSENQEFGDAKHHEVTYDLVAHTPFKQYFPATWPLASNPEGTRFTEPTPNAFTIHIPASRRPAPPQIEYIVPSFGWSRGASTDGKTRTSSRSGGSLRVYLRRPWFSSGNGEKLAVVILAPTTGKPVTEPILQNTTKLGADPVFKHGDVPTTVSAALFGGGEAAKNLAAPDIAGAYATAIPYPVHFDDEKQMWYADIVINSGAAYTPFVRLALARYQQHALAGLQLSSIKTADIMQLQMSRSATVTFNDPANKLRVSLVGHLGESAAGPNRIYGTIEEKVGADDDTGWRTVLIDGDELTRTIPISSPGLIAQPGVIRPPGTIRQPPPDEAEPSEDFLEAEDQVTRPPTGGQVRPGVQPQIRPEIAAPQAVPGEFTLPKARTAGTYRLVVREYEVFATDTGDAEMPETPKPANAPPLTMVPPRLGARLVYMDVIPLS